MARTMLTTGGMPLHRQLYLVLRDQIDGGTYRAGDVLPTEEALGASYGVSRITVRRALQDLADQGLVDRRQGRGTFVARRSGQQPVSPTSLRASLERAQSETTVTVVEFGPRVPPPMVADALALGDGDEALYVLRVRSRGGRPLMLTEAWVPGSPASAVTATALRHRALFELVEASGVRLGRYVQEICAEIADPVRAGLLGTDIGAPLLRIDRLVHDGGGAPVMRNTLLVDARHSHVHSDIAGADIDTAATGVLVFDPAP